VRQWYRNAPLLNFNRLKRVLKEKCYNLRSFLPLTLLLLHRSNACPHRQPLQRRTSEIERALLISFTFQRKNKLKKSTNNNNTYKNRNEKRKKEEGKCGATPAVEFVAIKRGADKKNKNKE
jgi:hypothetical protein